MGVVIAELYDGVTFADGVVSFECAQFLVLYLEALATHLNKDCGTYVCVCMYVCMYVCMWGLVVKLFWYWAHDPWVMGSSPTTRR